ncbi:ATP-binding protein [Sphingobium limneticum]|uniref:ATP-binding protein n=1 Tax=Sphingobium limneticum TaxID=1007511 RepID=UPI00123E1486|nr:ATP-binding protein [Sphingobium limneticum]KAA9013018.1 ATP-binding protein [Sphingobium limneticum]
MNWFSKKLKGAASAPDPIVRSAIGGMHGKAEGSAELPFFKVLATDQLHRGRGSEADKARAQLREAFTPSQPVSRISMFAGREAVLTRLIRAIEDQQLHVVVYGERGIGKTSLLRILTRLADEAKYIVCYTSCGENSNFSDMFRSIAGAIPMLFHSDYAPTQSEIESGGTLADLLPAGEVTPHQISDLFSKLSSTRVLVILDEFDRSPSGAFRRMIAELVKNLSDRSTRVQMVIAGVAGNLAELVEHIPSVRRNILGLQIPNMTAAEVGELIGRGSESCGLRYDDDAIELITRISCGLPYIASLLGQHAGIGAVDRGSTQVLRSDVTNALKLVIDETRQRLSDRSLRAAKRLQVAGKYAELLKLADVALHHAGIVDLVGSSTELGEALRIGLEAQLIEPVGEEVGERFRFVEEGVPVYLWMQSIEGAVNPGYQQRSPSGA